VRKVVKWARCDLASLVLSAVSLGLVPFGASAASVTFESVSGIWTDAASSPTLSGVDSSSIRWGRPVSGNQQSGYDFGAASPFTANAGSAFSLGQFTHLNNAIYGPSISMAKLSINYQFRLEHDEGNLIERSFDVDFSHLETRNNARVCADGGTRGQGVNAAGCADKVTLALFADIIDTFTVGEMVYTLTLGGFDTGSTFWTEEGKANVSNLMGQLSVVLDDTSSGGQVPPPVPLPAGGVLLVSALLGLVWFRRKV